MHTDVRHVFQAKYKQYGMPEIPTLTVIIHNEIYYLTITFPNLVASVSVRLQKMKTQMPEQMHVNNWEKMRMGKNSE